MEVASSILAPETFRWPAAAAAGVHGKTLYRTPSPAAFPLAMPFPLRIRPATGRSPLRAGGHALNG